MFQSCWSLLLAALSRTLPFLSCSTGFLSTILERRCSLQFRKYKSVWTSGKRYTSQSQFSSVCSLTSHWEKRLPTPPKKSPSFRDGTNVVHKFIYIKNGDRRFSKSNKEGLFQSSIKNGNVFFFLLPRAKHHHISSLLPSCIATQVWSTTSHLRLLPFAMDEEDEHHLCPWLGTSETDLMSFFAFFCARTVPNHSFNATSRAWEGQ